MNKYFILKFIPIAMYFEMSYFFIVKHNFFITSNTIRYYSLFSRPRVNTKNTPPCGRLTTVVSTKSLYIPSCEKDLENVGPKHELFKIRRYVPSYRV